VAVNQSGQGTKVLNVVNNTLTFGGDFTSGNSIIIKTGQGKLVLAGSGVSQFVGRSTRVSLTSLMTLIQPLARATRALAFWCNPMPWPD
jgi:hypothetical protein